MRPRTVASVIAAGRVVVGLGLLVAPGAAGRAWIGGNAGRRSVQVAVRALGVRDAVLGAGALLALRHGRGLRGWVEAGAVVDAVDALATLAALDDLGGRGAVATVAVASSAAVVGGWAARAIGRGSEIEIHPGDEDPAWRPHSPGHVGR